MLRGFYLKVGLLFFALFTLFILLIYAPPDDDHELRALLMPEDCEMPCFMGIRPGVTTVDEALKLLRENQWVDAESVRDDSGVIRWVWSKEAPTLLDRRAYTHQEYLVFYDNVIETMVIATRVKLGEFWLLRGKPSVYGVVTLPNPLDSPRTKEIFGLYDDRRFTVWGYVECPYFINFWNTEIRIELSQLSDTRIRTSDPLGWPIDYSSRFDTRAFFMNPFDRCRQ